MVNVAIVCFDTKHPTYAPSVAPTTPAPTLAPTEICASIKVEVDVTKDPGVSTYNGVYNKQSSTINGYDWWVSRNDVGATDASGNATIYFSTSHNRWVIEASDIYWEANTTQHSIGQVDDGHLNKEDDRRQPHGINDYFGKHKWLQYSMNYASGMLFIDITCYDTKHPTYAPSIAPTTAAPTLAPTEICESVTVSLNR